MRKLNIIVVGCGSAGTRHIRNLQDAGIKNIIACDTNPKKLTRARKEYGVRAALIDYKRAFKSSSKIDAAFICTPHNRHIQPALFFARRGTHLFMEKPLSNNLKGIKALIGTVNEKKLIAMMGMCYRFHPGLKIIKEMIGRAALGRVYSARIRIGQYLPDWHPSEDYKNVTYAKESEGGGVVLTGTHGYDYIRWLFGEPGRVLSYSGKLSNLKIDVEDITSAIIMSKKNILVSYYHDFLQRWKGHKMDIICEKGDIYWDFYVNQIRIFHGQTRKWKIIKYKFKLNDMHKNEIDHFLMCLDRKKPDKTLDIRDGLKTLKFALGAKNYAV